MFVFVFFFLCYVPSSTTMTVELCLGSRAGTGLQASAGLRAHSTWKHVRLVKSATSHGLSEEGKQHSLKHSCQESMPFTFDPWSRRKRKCENRLLSRNKSIVELGSAAEVRSLLSLLLIFVCFFLVGRGGEGGVNHSVR